MRTPTPRSAAELNEMVASLLAAYVEQGRQAVLAALETPQSKPPSSSPQVRRRPNRGSSESSVRRRRTPDEMAEVVDRLLALVREHPGEGMLFFSAQLGLPCRALTRPMNHLKRQQRVRKVGERQQARYFPMVASLGD